MSKQTAVLSVVKTGEGKEVVGFLDMTPKAAHDALTAALPAMEYAIVGEQKALNHGVTTDYQAILSGGNADGKTIAAAFKSKSKLVKGLRAIQAAHKAMGALAEMKAKADAIETTTTK
jgi:hypothetical protein